MRTFKTLLIALTFMLALTACSSSDDTSGKDIGPLMLADVGWDSIQFHNSIAKIIIEEGYGYETDIIPVSTAAAIQGLETGDVDIYLEFWTDNVRESYDELIATGKAIELGLNLDDNMQGLYVPTYMIEGDPERGIEPMAPDLKKLEDLPQYWELFKDREDKSKGLIVGAVTGWEVANIIQEKMKTYNLEETYNHFLPGSEAALTTSLANAYEEGEAWVGYYWEPSWVLGKYDMTLLEEPEYNEEGWNNGFATAFPSNRITVVANEEVVEKAPEVTEFLKKYTFTTALLNQILAEKKEAEMSSDEAAKVFLQENEDIWTAWVPADVAEKVKSSLK